ncbi:RHS repeat domain-containing protein, partial [Streptomyces cyaneofuscatus]|uniref:RHS repeat domain-containing protein n=1 Tax=Streptomyces cyaneofuscatus TaxID=66883 RepID=UPI00381CCAAC
MDERRGEARFGMVLGGVSGPAGSGLEVKAQYSQGLSTAGVDRFGLGSGMSLGLPFVDNERGVLVLSASEHRMDASAESGLASYKLKDVKLSRGAGDSPVPHAFVLESFKDGSKQYFDELGDLVAVQDRYDHVTKLTWQLVNGQHRLESVTGGWGSKLSVRFEGSKVVFVSPKRWGQAKAPETVVELAQNRVKSVTVPSGQKTGVEWSTKGSNAVVVPAAVVSPTGARTEFGYSELEARSGGVVAVSAFEVKGADGRQLIEPVTVSLDPDGENRGRNYTGCPEYCEDGTDRLENSGDGSFTYRVRFSQKNGQEVERTYNALHLQKSEVNRVQVGSQSKEVSRTEFTYPGEKADGTPPKVKDAPGDAQIPSLVKITSSDPNDPSRKRGLSVSAQADEMGRSVKMIEGGVETSTEYGPYSLPMRSEKRDTVTGARQVTESTLTTDRKAIAETVTKAAKDTSRALETVSTSIFDYHGGELAGEVSKTRATGDPEAKGGDPGAAVSSTETSIEKDGQGVGRRTNTLTGPDGVESTSVSDLASGVTLSEKTGDLAETTREYDIMDRPVTTLASDGEVTKFSYETLSGGPDEPGGTSVTSRRKSDGFAARSVSDELNRKTSSESNYQPAADGGRGGILPDGQWRQVSATQYNTHGQQTRVLDAGGRATTTEYNAWGQPSKTTAPDGTQVVRHTDDVAGTSTTQTIPAGGSEPTLSSTKTVDGQGNLVRSEATYGDGTPGAVAETSYDAFGKPTSSEGERSMFIANHEYTSAGRPEADTLTLKQNGLTSSSDGGPTPFASPPMSPGSTAAGHASTPDSVAQYTLDAFGNKTQKKLTQGDESTQGWRTKFDAAGRTAQVTAPGGGWSSVTAYSRVNGLVESETLPDGSVAHQRTDSAGRTTEAWTSPKDDPSTKRDHVHTSYDTVTGGMSGQWIEGNEASSKIAFVSNADGSVRERTDPGGKKTFFTYTNDEQVASVTDHTGAVTRYTYDAKSGRMTDAVQSRGEKELARVSYIYDPSGRLAKIDRGNGVTSAYTFNDGGLPSAEKHTGPGGGTIAEHTYTYTPNRKLATDTATAREMDGSQSRTATAHSYDAEGRLVLTHITEGDKPREGALITRSDYTYDLASNLTEAKTTTP